MGQKSWGSRFPCRQNQRVRNQCNRNSLAIQVTTLFRKAGKACALIASFQNMTLFLKKTFFFFVYGFSLLIRGRRCQFPPYLSILCGFLREVESCDIVLESTIHLIFGPPGRLCPLISTPRTTLRRWSPSLLSMGVNHTNLLRATAC